MIEKAIQKPEHLRFSSRRILRKQLSQIRERLLFQISPGENDLNQGLQKTLIRQRSQSRRGINITNPFYLRCYPEFSPVRTGNLQQFLNRSPGRLNQQRGMIHTQIPTTAVSITLPELLPATILIGETAEFRQNPMAVRIKMKITACEQALCRLEKLQATADVGHQNKIFSYIHSAGLEIIYPLFIGH